MNKYNRKCLLCGEEYSYCPTCSKDIDKPIWYREFNNENCKAIFDILSYYNAHLISKEEAAEKLAECDLKHINSWSEKNQEFLAEIFDEE